MKFKKEINQQEISRQERYCQYLNDNNLEDAYVPTQGNPFNTFFFFLESVFFIEFT